ncbi:MAG: DUF58 domain-containing protein [Acidimicrobiales bacterium]
MTRRATERFLTAVVLTVSAALVAVLGGRPDAAVLVAPWLVLMTLGLSRRRDHSPKITVRTSTDRVLAGDDVELTTTLVGSAGTVRVSCRPSDGFWRADSPTAVPVEEAMALGRADVTMSLAAHQWGQHDLGRVHVEITDPFGLFRSGASTAAPTNLLVHPTPTDLHDLLTPWLVRRISGAHGSKEVGRGVEYADIRPYTPGDSLREINWRASARSNELWVSQRHPDRASDVILLVDSFVESGHDVKTVVGLAIEAAVALAESHLAVSDRVGLVELGGVVRWVSPGTGRLQLQRLTDALLSTSLYANASERNLGVIPPRALPPRSFVVALSPLLDERFIDSLFVMSGRGHDVAVIECPSSLASRDNTAPDVVELRSAALDLWEAERQVIRDHLADHGVAIASWQPGEHLDMVLGELSRRRIPLARSARR